MSINLTSSKYKIGDKVICNGYPATIMKVEDWDDGEYKTTYIEARLGSGLVATSPSSLDVENA